MAKAKTTISPPPPGPWGVWITRAAFVLTLAVMIARALMSETVRDAFGMGSAATAVPRGPGAATTLLLDALCCVPALLVLLRRAIEREYVVRWSWSQALLGALAVWAAISVAWSGDQFSAVVAAANLISMTSLAWSTAQLVRSWMRLRIVAGVCFGILLVYTVHGLIYRFVDLPDTAKVWSEQREEFLRARGWEPDSAIAKQFERKVLSGELPGFNQSPNSYAAVIVTLMIVSAGIAIQRRASGDSLTWTVFIFAAMTPALLVLYFTGSRTAVGTLMLAGGAFALLALVKVRNWLAAHPTKACAAAACVIALGTAALVGHGVYHGSLPQDSLNFRWRYWVAAAELVKQHPLAGVGWGNFGPNYLSVRVPAAAEEVRDPHNFIVRAFAELGIVGGMLMLAWLARAAWELTRPITPGPVTSMTKTSLATGLSMIVAIIALGVLLNVAAAVDFSQISAYILLEVFRRLLYLGLLCVGVVIATTRTGRPQQMDDRGGEWVLYGMLIALAAFFTHNLVDFVIGEAGSGIVFAVLLGAALGARTPSAAGERKHRRIAAAALAIATIAWIAGILTVVVPVIDAEQQAQAADEVMRRGDFRRAVGLLDSAHAACRFNADYPYRAALAAIAGGLQPERARASLTIAIAGDPTNAMYYLSRARHELRQPAPDIPAVRFDFDNALALDPQNVEVRLEYADLLRNWNDFPAASEQITAALETNRQYDPKEPERLSEERVKALEAMISRPAR